MLDEAFIQVLIEELAGTDVPPAASADEARPTVAGAETGWQLRVVVREEADRVVPLGAAPVTIGRRPKNTIVVRCDRVSREHARFWLDEHGPQVEDLGARNGIRINGTRTRSGSLQAGDVVKVGSVKIHVESVVGDVGAD